MTYLKLYNLVAELPIGNKKSIIIDGDIEVYILRPLKIFKGYDINKNFQIFLKEGEREFRPNHLRVIIDLHLRRISRPDLKNDLLLAFDKIFYKEDALKSIKTIEHKEFKHCLNSLKIIASLHQLFLIEQELNYTKASNYDPITLFYQGWIRQAIDSPKEIDNLVMSICRFQPPSAKYTSKENRKNKKFKEELDALWYTYG